jgi:DNA topoisomerase-1
VNEYLREITGQDFTSKDFRTWTGTVLAARGLRALVGSHSQRQAKRNVLRAVEEVASRLGNTVSVCRKCYIHPAVIDAYLDGSLADGLSRKLRKALNGKLGRLEPDECAVLAFLDHRDRAVKRARRNAPSLVELLEKSLPH